MKKWVIYTLPHGRAYRYSDDPEVGILPECGFHQWGRSPCCWTRPRDGARAHVYHSALDAVLAVQSDQEHFPGYERCIECGSLAVIAEAYAPQCFGHLATERGVEEFRSTEMCEFCSSLGLD